MGQMHDLTEQLKGELLTMLVARHGPLLGGTPLRQALGYSSAESLRKAVSRGHVAVRLFTLPKRRGVYALTTDVAKWLAEASAPQEQERSSL